MYDGVAGLVMSEGGERLLVCKTGCHLLGSGGWVETNQLFQSAQIFPRNALIEKNYILIYYGHIKNNLMLLNHKIGSHCQGQQMLSL